MVAMPTMMAALKLRLIRMVMMARQPKPIHSAPLHGSHIAATGHGYVKIHVHCPVRLQAPHRPLSGSFIRCAPVLIWPSRRQSRIRALHTSGFRSQSPGLSLRMFLSYGGRLQAQGGCQSCCTRSTQREVPAPVELPRGALVRGPRGGQVGHGAVRCVADLGRVGDEVGLDARGRGAPACAQHDGTLHLAHPCHTPAC